VLPYDFALSPLRGGHLDHAPSWRSRQDWRFGVPYGNCSDFVFVTPDLTLSPPVQVLLEQTVSDHHPVVAIVAAAT